MNIAAEYCTVEIVQNLTSSNAHIGAATKEYGTALRVAASRETGGLPIIEFLLQANTLASSVHLGTAAALDEALSFFGTTGENLYDFDPNSIREVLRAGPGAVVKLLLANLPDTKVDDSRYGLLFHMACINGDKDYVELLLQRGIDVNGCGGYYGTALQAASHFGNAKIAERLLSYDANVNALEGVHGTALRASELGGHEDLVRTLVACGADVNLRYKDRGNSVLHLALELRSHATFKALLDAGADTSFEMSGQQHILIAACKHGDATFVELLLAASIDANLAGIEPYQGATPLIAACEVGHFSAVRLLLDY